MNPILKNILAVIAGLFGGSVVNMGIIKLGGVILPMEGVDPNSMESLSAFMQTAEPQYFAPPFLAHAIGTLAGAVIAALIAANHKMKFALSIGVLFLFGGITAITMIPGPTWFAILDIAVAYIPMAYIGGKLGNR